MFLGGSSKPPNWASSSSIVYAAIFSWGFIERIEFIFSSGWTSTEAGIEEKEDRLDALDFMWLRSSSTSRPKISLLECLVEDDEEGYS